MMATVLAKCRNFLEKRTLGKSTGIPIGQQSSGRERKRAQTDILQLLTTRPVVIAKNVKCSTWDGSLPASGLLSTVTHQGYLWL